MVQPLVRLADGTVRQVGPLTGTHVWTIPGRANRPIAHPVTDAHQLTAGEADRLCPFCAGRYLETTPEKSRLVGSGQAARIEHGRLPSEIDRGLATARRFANLFEITSTRSWRINHGYVPSAEVVAWADRYLDDPVGLTHISSILGFRERMGGPPAPSPDDHGAMLSETTDLLAGSHDVLVPRRHVVDGAGSSDQLAAGGTMTPGEHADLIAYTVATLEELYRAQPADAYVSVFQNWLRPAGASLEHLHKQLVAIDGYGPQTEYEAGLLAQDPQLYQHAVLDLAVAERLVVAATDHAVAVAGVGHRYPSLEVYSTSPREIRHFSTIDPWTLRDRVVAALDDLRRARLIAPLRIGEEVLADEVRLQSPC